MSNKVIRTAIDRSTRSRCGSRYEIRLSKIMPRAYRHDRNSTTISRDAPDIDNASITFDIQSCLR